MAQQVGFPDPQGLYDPIAEHDNCGVGFVVNIKGEKSHSIVRQGIEILVNLAHRGATGADPHTGDGAGLLLQLPDDFLRTQSRKLNIELPAPGAYAVGMVFLSPSTEHGQFHRELVERVFRAERLSVLGWRDVPIDPKKIGPLARETLPTIKQLFVASQDGFTGDSLEVRLYVARKVVENAIRNADRDANYFHFASLSTRTIVYKGLMLAHQIEGFFPDLAEKSLISSLALVHQRYSTNTFPTWDLAQPFRFLGHNGEINTLRGNVNWMHAREASLKSEIFGDDLKRLFPIITPNSSDSGQFDNVLEFLFLNGRSLPHAMLMMIPEAWDAHDQMADKRRAFYEYHSFLLEPWDGPASMAFTDGRKVGAILDRNGLRPSRYTITKDGLVVMASETGTIDIPFDRIETNGRLQPGKIFFIDTEEGRIVGDDEIKDQLVSRRPYRAWIKDNFVKLDDIPSPNVIPLPNRKDLFARQQVFGYTEEDLKIVLSPMVVTGQEAVGSMGDDSALACLSDRPRLLYHYFKQLFAQVTNPAIDSLRERLVMSLVATVGQEGNLLSETPEHAREIELPRPVITDLELAKLLQVDKTGFKSKKFDMLFNATQGDEALEIAVHQLCQQASAAVADQVEFLILSDRGVNRRLAPIPALLATGAVHHHLVREGTRTRCAIIVETGEAREVGHFALLIGYGVSAINPYLAFETIAEMVRDGTFTPKDQSYDEALQHYLKSIDKGLLKIFAKMGISTLQSYHGAQIFEAIGLSQELIDHYFTGTPSKVSGIGLREIARETVMRHRQAFPEIPDAVPTLDPGGLYQWRRRGERHTFNPDTITKLQQSVRDSKFETFEDFTKAANDEARRLTTLRGMLRFKWAEASVPLEQVEPASEIVKRFCTGAMSYGSISREAHETLAIAMNRIGGKSNTGEGGEEPERFSPDPNGDLRRSAIKQVASGRFGVTSWYLVNADELQIKISQGAKPGEGGQLPGHKVDEVIARTRYSTPGVGLISPPPHHDIYSIEDLAQLIHDLKNANHRANISVKLVAETGVGTIAAGVAKGKADGILIAGHDGGTGASPQTSIKTAGLPWEIGLAETQQTLVLNNLRGRIRLQVDGGLKTGRDVAMGALLGADEFGFSTAPLVVMGCIMMRVCHLNTCPVGIATQNPELRKRFAGKPEHVIQYFFFVAEDLRRIMAKLGFRSVQEMIGRSDRLEFDRSIDHWKAKKLDFSKLLFRPNVPYATHWCEKQDHGLAAALDNQLLVKAIPALDQQKPVIVEMPIRNVHRTVGTLLGSELSRRFGLEGLPEDTIQLRFHGIAGQSFGAFVPKGITLTLTGAANDYVGKGLSGGKNVVRTPGNASYKAHENIIIGNVAFYGATGGEAYINGIAGERFAVRNSGVTAVVEGVGDHGCEYMTGGRVVVLGATGRNFAAGMSGGIAYVFDPEQLFSTRCNLSMVDLEELTDEDDQQVRKMIQRHVDLTNSERGRQVLRQWQKVASQFIKVMPIDYKRAKDERLKAESGNG